MAPDTLLELRDVSVHYGQFQALDLVTYVVPRGSIVSLLGGNASGKSTSMKAICGTVSLSSGDVFWEGERISRESTQRRMRRGIGVVPEGRRVFASLSVRENLQVGGWASGTGSESAQLIDELLETFPELKRLVDRPAGVLSGGEQQMVAVARALMRKPELVLMDEPSMGLSPVLVKRTFKLIEEIRDRGISVFVVEQNARAALRIADYAYVLSAGRLVLEGLPHEISDDPLMREAYLGKGAA